MTLFVAQYVFPITIPDLTAYGSHGSDECNARKNITNPKPSNVPQQGYCGCTLAKDHRFAHIAGDETTTWAIWQDDDDSHLEGLFINGIKTPCIVFMEPGSAWDRKRDGGCSKSDMLYTRGGAQLVCTNHAIPGHHVAEGGNHVMSIMPMTSEEFEED